MKKILTFIFVALLPMIVNAYTAQIDGIYYDFSGNNATVTYQKYDSNYISDYSGVVVIPGSVTYAGNTYTVTSIGNYAFYNCSGLTSITIPSSVTSIGSSAFSGCRSLTSITIPEGVTSINNSAFSGCSGLTSIKVDSGNTKYDSRDNCNAIIQTASNALVAGCQKTVIPSSVTSIGQYAFYGCTSLKSITIPSSVTSIGNNAFNYCYDLISIKVDSGNAKYDSRNNCNAIILTASNTLIAGCQNTVIPGSVTSIGSYAFRGCRGLTSVTIPNSVTSIGDGAFGACSSLTSVTIPGSVTSIGESAFSDCSGLTSVTIGNGVTKILGYTFYGCTGLTSVTIGSGVTSINSNAFGNSPNITSLTLYCGNIGAWFSGRANLQTITIGDNVTAIGDSAFKGCSGLTSITIPNSVSSIGSSAFSGCSGLTSVTIPNSVTSIGSSAFYGCSGLTSITIPNSVSSIGSSAFYGCSGLTSVNIGNSVTSIGSSAFYGCTGLTSVNIPNSVTTIGASTFEGCNSLSVTIGSGVTSIGDNAFAFNGGTVKINAITPPTIVSTTFNAGVTILVPASSVNAYRNADIWSDYAVRIISQSAKTDYNINVTAQSSSSGIHQAIGEDNLINVMTLKVKGSINSYDIMIMRNKMHNLHNLDLTEASIVANSYEYYKTYHTTDNVIGDYAFYSLQKLISVKLPKTITGIGQYAFANCRGLRNVEFQDGLKTIGSDAFNGCSSLPSVTTKKELETINQNAFYGCSNLESVNIEECTAINNGAFRELGSLKSINIEKCTTIGANAFYGCSNLVSVSLPEGLETIGDRAFYFCTSLPGITLPKGLVTIGSEAFRGCNKLEAVSFPNTLKTIAASAFYQCTSLKAISLPTSLTNIGKSAFYGCTSLEELHIPASISVIGETAFSGCAVLKDVYTYTVEPTTINQYTFSCWTTATLHVPYFSYNNYYWDTQWSQFAFLVQFGDTYKYDYFYINNDYTFSDLYGVVTGVPDADLNAGSGLIVETTNENLVLDEVHMASNGSTSASIIANNNLTVEKLYFDLTVAANKWYFVTFPFRVKLSNVTSPGNFVFRYYDGQERATNGKGGWKNVAGNYLLPGQGYIFQTNTAGTLTLLVEKADMDFSGNDKQDALGAYPATTIANASWNFLGNPYPSYFDINQTGYTAPITVWTGSAYQAIRPGDDQYYLQPFQAFFVQKPEDTAAISFPATGRYTYQQIQEMTATASVKALANVEEDAVPVRCLVNLTIADTDSTVNDRTRVVYNNEKNTDYEMDCDAAKFFAGGQVAQLYSLDAQGTQYAINERPLGDVNLGYIAATKGKLTINAVRMDRPVYLRDNELGITHDLSVGGYTFTTEAGSNEDRFTLVLENTATGIKDIEHLTSDAEHSSGTWYDLQGRRVGRPTLQSGAYIMKAANGEAKKMLMK